MIAARVRKLALPAQAAACGAAVRSRTAAAGKKNIGNAATGVLAIDELEHGRGRTRAVHVTVQRSSSVVVSK